MVFGCFKCLGGGPSNRDEQQQPQQQQQLNPQILPPPPPPPQRLLIEDVPDDIQYFTFEELNAATDGFSDSLGQGGFAGVFRGTLPDGRVVAVKRADMDKEYGRESFLAEMNCLKLVQLRHANIIRLIGYHATVDDMMLVLEYMPLGSLDSHTHNLKQSKKKPLDWSTRLNVVKGTAMALAFLHAQNVLHRDLKLENVLVDEGFVPKIADFGLGLLVANSADITISRPMGTFGYIDPSWVQNRTFSSKSDVYSFGVILLELLTGRKALVGGTSLVTEAKAIVHFQLLLDPVIVKAPRNELRVVLEIARVCLQDDPAQRPTMAEIVHRLSLVGM